MNDLQAAIKQRLLEAQNILLVSHVRPDGDAIGSLLAFGLALQGAGKKVQMVLPDGVPSSFRHLPGSDQVAKTAEGTFDLAIVVDCADLKRVGKSLDGYSKPDLNIDHHVTNECFGNLNLIEPNAVATSSILFRHLPEWGYALTQPVAANLVTGIVTDTLGFRTTNTTPEALRQVAGLSPSLASSWAREAVTPANAACCAGRRVRRSWAAPPSNPRRARRPRAAPPVT